MTRPTVLRLVPPTASAAPAHVGEERSPPEPTPSSRGGHRALAALPDGGLVALAAQGDSAAAECLYRRHASFALNLATRIAGTTNEAEDVVHDAFLRAFQRLDRLREPAAFRMWLGTIVVHGVRSRLRREKLRRLLGLADSRGSQPVDLDRIASPTASSAGTLRHIEGHELEEAAGLAGCSLATVKRRIQRAQAHLDAHFVTVTPHETEGGR